MEDRVAHWDKLALDIEARYSTSQYDKPIGPYLPVPQAKSPQVQELINPLYRGALTQNPFGNGSTAAAIRHERLTGRDVFGKLLGDRNKTGHSQKAEEAVLNIKKILKTDLHPSDRQILQSELDSLQHSLSIKQEY